MPTLEEVLNSNNQSLSTFLPESNDDESLVDETSLTPEELSAAAVLGINTKRLSKKAYDDLKKKAEGIVKGASVGPKKTTQELAEGFVKKGKKSAEASAKQFVKAQPSLGFPTKEVAEAASDAVPSGVFKSAAELPAGKTPFLSRIATLASSPAGKSVLGSLGLAGTLSGLYGDLSEDQDEPANSQMTPMETANTATGKPINIYPEGGRSEMNPIMASSMYDSPEQIVADLSRPKEQQRTLAAKEETPSKALAPAPRTISAGEPSAQEVQRQAEDRAIADILGAGQQEKSRYQDLLDRYRGALAMEGAERFVSAMGGIKPREGFYRETLSQQEELRRNIEQEDPNSPLSKQYQEIVKSMGIGIKGNESAASLMRALPFLQQYQSQKENREARQQDLKLRFAEIAARKDESKDEKKDRFIQALRKETTSGALGKMFSNYNTATRMGTALEEFAKNPTAYSDYATLMGGLKALQGDESVVREAEVRLGMSATSLANKVKNWTDRLWTGKSLQPSQRDEMVKAVKVLSETARKQYSDAVSPIMKQAESIGINKDMLINEGFLSEKKSETSAPIKILVEKDGKQFRLPKEQLQRAISQGYKEVK